jgi:uncharacterized protein YqjF (DUF2071 family)
MSFLTAEWRKLAIANYSIDADILIKYLPAGTELDIWQDKCYVSLVGFLFKDTRLRGIRIPFHSNFEEVNLRFYVRYKEDKMWKRAVVFIKEIVPRYALAFVANTFYREHYQTVPMRYLWTEVENALDIVYEWRMKGHWQSFSVNAVAGSIPIEVGSEAEFITEHYWGYSKFNESTTIEYEVKHPRWEQYLVNGFNINVDFNLNYGADFSFLNDQAPDSVMLAEGSTVSVENKKVIKLT